MGTMTNTEMQTELRRNLGNRSTAEFDSDRLQLLLNLAQVRLARVYRWDELEDVQSLTTGFTSTPADDKYLTVPVGTRKIHSMRLLDDEHSRKLRWVHPRNWDKIVPMPEDKEVNRPTHYTRYNEKFEFFRVPDAAYSLELRRSIWPTKLTSGAQTSDFLEKDDLLILLATVIAWTQLGKEDRAMGFWKIYRSMLGDAIPDAEETPDAEIKGFDGPYREGPLGEYWANPFIMDTWP